MIFNHSGSMGDLFSSLHFVIQLLESLGQTPKDAVFNIPVDIPCARSPYREGVNIPKVTGDFIAPLLQYMGFTVMHDKPSVLAGNIINLDFFRSLPINLNGGDLRDWYYQAYDKHLPQDFSRKLLSVSPDTSLGLQNKIILLRTFRYINPKINWKQLQCFKSYFVFTGFEYQHEAFCKNFFQVPFMPVKDSLDAAVKMASSKGVIGNPCGLYHIAELLKVPRIYISTEWNQRLQRGPLTTLPCGGWHETVRVDCKLFSSVSSMLNGVLRSNCKSHIDQFLNDTVFFNKRQGVFLECGANDGKRDSISYSYEKDLDWQGVLIEPQEVLMNKCKAVRRKENTYIQKGLGEKEESLQMTIPEDNLDNASFSLSEEHIQTLKKTGYGKSYRKQKIDIISYHKLLQEIPYDHIDLAIFDVEGFEACILRSLMQTQVLPEILVVQYDWSNLNELRNIVSSKYKELKVFDHDIVFQRKQ